MAHTHLRKPAQVALWPGESVTHALERLARSWNLDRAYFTGTSGSVAEATVRVVSPVGEHPRSQPVPSADVVCIAGEIDAAGPRPVADVKAVLRRPPMAGRAGRGGAEYVCGDLVRAEVSEPIAVVLTGAEDRGAAILHLAGEAAPSRIDDVSVVLY